MQTTIIFTTSFLALAAATPLQLLQPRAAVAIAGYEYAGCYTEATSTWAFSDLSYYDDMMTIEKCAAACSGYAWFGTEYDREVSLGSHTSMLRLNLIFISATVVVLPMQEVSRSKKVIAHSHVLAIPPKPVEPVITSQPTPKLVFSQQLPVSPRHMVLLAATVKQQLVVRFPVLHSPKMI